MRLSCSLLLVAAACSESPTRIDPRLAPLPDCDSAIAHVREVALAKMNREIDRLQANYDRGDYCYWGGAPEDADSGGVPPSPSPPTEPSGPTMGTGTNNQVVGVDEADFVKNDGQYIYLAQNGVLRIVDAWPADQAHQVSATALEGTPRKLFVEGDRALVYVADGAADGWRPAECTYGYDCNFTGDGTTTRALVYDISDRAAPQLLRSVALPGSLIAGRRIGNTVHTVVTSNPDPFEGLRYYPEEDLCGSDEPLSPFGGPSAAARYQAHRAYERLREANAEIIANTDLSRLLPVVVDSAHPLDNNACTSLFRSQVNDGAAFMTIASLDLTNDNPVVSSTIVSRAGAVYASSDALYVAVAHQSEADYSESASDVSCVHKFQIGEDPAATGYIGSGSVVGRALNQFAMDEKDGYLRIATTNGHVPNPDVSSRLTVLGVDDNELVEVGAVTDIAPTEDIRSVRFDGDRAFVVTFKKTDPLFTFDLSNPEHPRQLGELKIPGFSTYMHMLDDNHLLSIGYDADDHGDFAFFDGVLLQVFDVTNPETPTLAHRHVIGTRGSSSEALTNHLAFTYYRELGLLSVPMTLCEGGDDGQFGQNMTFSGLMLFDISTQTGIDEHGRVSHPVPEEVTCGNWWTQSNSAVKRSLFLDRYVYSISDADLKIQSVDALGTDLVSLPLD